MRFSTLSLLATVASAAFSFAVPVAPASSALEARTSYKDLHAILTDATATLAPLAGELAYVTSENCTAAILAPIVGDIENCLNVAITDVKGLVGLTLTNVLTTVDGVVLTVSDVAQLVCGLLTLIFTALGCVLKVVTAVERAAVQALLCEVVTLVATLLQLILNLVGGLLALLTPLLGGILAPVLSIIKCLGVTDVFSFLNVTWATVGSFVAGTTTLAAGAL